MAIDTKLATMDYSTLKDDTTSKSSYKILIQLRSANYEFTCRHNQTVLDAAEEANVELPISCGIGMCTECAAFLNEGDVELGEGSVCADECLERGYTLLCVTYPRSDLKLRADLDDNAEVVWQPQQKNN